MTCWPELILDTLLPRHCILCGLASGAANVCPPCSEELPRISHSCFKCGLPLTTADDRDCDRCRKFPVPWDSAAAALLYTFPVDQLVRRFKFSRNLAGGQVLAQEMIRAVRNRGIPMPDTLVPVPLHRSRFLTRPFNQSEVLARHIGKALNLPVSTHLLYRNRRTRAHSGLDAASRRLNIKGAFRLRKPGKPGTKLRYLALVDDVLTTGATLTECTRTMKTSGVERVSVWVAARAPAPTAQPE